MVLDDDELIRTANDKAVSMDFLSGTTLAIYIVDLMGKFTDDIHNHPSHVYIVWNFSMEEKYRARFE